MNVRPVHPDYHHPDITDRNAVLRSQVDTMTADERRSALMYLSGYTPLGFALAIESAKR